jgi:hypothetical protein
MCWPRRRAFKTLISQIYVNDDVKLETDVQFGVTRALIGDYVRHDGPAPAADVKGEWYSLDQTFVMEPGRAKLPRCFDHRQGAGENAQIRTWKGVSGLDRMKCLNSPAHPVR